MRKLDLEILAESGDFKVPGTPSRTLMNEKSRTVRERPKLCPCPRTCEPIWNAMVADPRIKDEQADMGDQGYSGDCVGRMKEPFTFVYGGATHTNDCNHCVFTPLKGIIRFQVTWEDLGNMMMMCAKALDVLRPLKCDRCGEDDRFTARFLHLVDPEWLKAHPNHTADEYNAAPRKCYCDCCAVYLGVLKPHPENFGIHGLSKYF